MNEVALTLWSLEWFDDDHWTPLDIRLFDNVRQSRPLNEQSKAGLAETKLR